MRYSIFIPALVVSMTGPIFGQLQDSSKAQAGASKKKIHSAIVVHPGPPVKPTQPAKPNGPEKSDWGSSAKQKR